MVLESEPAHGHGHKTGLPWLDIVVAVSVVFISLLSLVVSIVHGRTMEKLVHENERMVAASTMPFLTFGTGQIDPATGRPRVSFMVTNGGVGPAIVDWLDLRYKGVAYGDPADFVRACCAANMRGRAMPTGMYFSNLSGSILAAHDRRDILVAGGKTDPATLKSLASAPRDLDLRACYCSVLEQCWITDFSNHRPRPVPDCRVPAGVEPW